MWLLNCESWNCGLPQASKPSAPKDGNTWVFPDQPSSPPTLCASRSLCSNFTVYMRALTSAPHTGTGQLPINAVNRTCRVLVRNMSGYPTNREVALSPRRYCISPWAYSCRFGEDLAVQRRKKPFYMFSLAVFEAVLMHIPCLQHSIVTSSLCSSSPLRIHCLLFFLLAGLLHAFNLGGNFVSKTGVT